MAAYRALDPATEEEAPFRGRSAASTGLSSDERDFLRSSHGLPVEGIGRHRDLLGLDGARPLPGMAAGGSVRALVGLGPGRIRNREGDRLVVARDGRRDHQGPPRRDKKSGRNPTDRGKQGVKRSLLTEAAGMPLGIAVVGANRHHVTLVEATVASIPIDRPAAEEEYPQGMCMDKA